MRKKTFSLIEILVVITIIAILATMLLPFLTGGPETVKKKIAASQMQLIKGAIKSFRLEARRNPSSLAELSQGAIKYWDGNTVAGGNIPDPWYDADTCPGSVYWLEGDSTLKSKGPDWEAGTSDDIELELGELN